MNSKTEEIVSGISNGYYALYIASHSSSGEAENRPDADKVIAIYWPDVGIEIPWVKGMSIKESIIAWAMANS